MSFPQSKDAALINELLELMPPEEYRSIMSQRMCEYEPDFLGFLDIYKPLSELIPKEMVVIDLGSYLAAQSYFFADHRAYISVDTCKLRRFSPPNSVHYIMSIQAFIKDVYPRISKMYSESGIFAICSYVPDRDAVTLVRQTFQNVFCFYPCAL